MVPLLVQGYGSALWISAYIPHGAAGEYLDFCGKDVLLLYEYVVLNTAQPSNKIKKRKQDRKNPFPGIQAAGFRERDWKEER